VTSKTLARHYPLLDPAERFALMLAAAARGDEAEHARLAAAAPRVAVRVPHTYFRAMAFREVMDQHRMELLEAAALYFKAAHLAAEADGSIRDRLARTARLFGYLVRVNDAGWRRFCDRAGLPDAALAPHLPGAVALRQAIDEAEAGGLMDEEAEAYAMAECPTGFRLKTTESVAADLRATFEARLAWWGEDR
jgi:hypothetical protein